MTKDHTTDPESPSGAQEPNEQSAQAIVQLEAGKSRRFASAAALMADLNADD
jgi:hypothetical protein